MAERNSWWRSLTTRHKPNASSKDAAEQGQVSGPGSRATADKGKPPNDGQADPKQASEAEEGMAQDEQPTFNEKNSRRNLKVSRSGRFKEKRRTRAAIPVSYDEKNPAGNGDVR